MTGLQKEFTELHHHHATLMIIFYDKALLFDHGKISDQHPPGAGADSRRDQRKSIVPPSLEILLAILIFCSS